jgi:NIMA (never in mitosis gene a)-related kinase
MGCSSPKAIPIQEANEEEDNNSILRREISVPIKISTHKAPQIPSEEEQENFIIVKNIGSNNICHCYLIRSTETNEVYAYKKVNISDANDESVKKIKNDVEILKTLDHPNVIMFINALFSDDQKTLFLFTEYADDGNLQMKLDENKENNQNFGNETLLNWLMQICLALKYIHEKDILHRDIKPSNIFLMKNIAKLGNFGVAKALNPKLRHAKTMVATPQYLAPEIINKEKYSFKADIWSLGVTFFQLMYLTYPFEGKTNEEMQKNILAGKRKEISNSFPYDSKLVELINKMLSKRPEERPSAAEILDNSIISSRMSCYLKENEYDQLKAQEEIKNYENENAKINENKRERKFIVIEEKLKKFIKHDSIELAKKRDQKAKYDLNRQMTLMEDELIRKSNTLEK